MSTSRFFQFPLFALVYGQSELERLETLVCYCRFDAGFKEYARNPSAAQAVAVPANCRVSDEDYRAWHLGSTRAPVQGGEPKTSLKRYRDLHDFCEYHLAPFVHIRGDWLWNCVYGLRGTHAEKPLSYPEFTILCALLSKIGTKKSSPCTWQEIKRRALGYTTEDHMTEKLPYRSDGAKPLTRQQIRTLLDRLETNRFFARSVAYIGKAAVRGHFSFSMPRGKLAARVAERIANRRKPYVGLLRSQDKETCQVYRLPQLESDTPEPVPGSNHPSTTE